MASYNDGYKDGYKDGYHDGARDMKAKIVEFLLQQHMASSGQAWGNIINDTFASRVVPNVLATLRD